MAALCARCGHLRSIHRRPRVFWALLGRWACRHAYRLGTFGEPDEVEVRCACDGWVAA